jgi:hypothetical protein
VPYCLIIQYKGRRAIDESLVLLPLKQKQLIRRIRSLFSIHFLTVTFSTETEHLNYVFQCEGVVPHKHSRDEGVSAGNKSAGSSGCLSHRVYAQ